MKIYSMLFLIVVSTFSQTGCASTSDAKTAPRENARAAVIMLAKTTAAADEVCATLARTKQDAQLAKKCADAYDVIRPSLLAADSGVDAWESGSRNQVACAIGKTAAALTEIVEAVQAAGGSLPLAVPDSISFVRTVVGECHPVVSGGTSNN